MIHSLVKLAESDYRFASTYCLINVDRKPPKEGAAIVDDMRVMAYNLDTKDDGSVTLTVRDLSKSVSPVLDDKGKPVRGFSGAAKKDGATLEVPAFPYRSGTKVLAAFLVDKGEYVFGVAGKQGADSAAKKQDYIRQVEGYAAFCENEEEYKGEGVAARTWLWWLDQAAIPGDVGPGTVIVPSINGVYLHSADAARIYHRKALLDEMVESSVEGTCLICGSDSGVCGDTVQKPRLAIGNVGVSLTSVDADPFKSYGLGAATTAVCPTCALAIATTITKLATTEGYHYKVGDSTFLFYCAEDQEVVPDLLHYTLANSITPLDVANFFDSVVAGKTVKSLEEASLDVLVIDTDGRTARIAAHDRVPLIKALNNAKRWSEQVSVSLGGEANTLTPIWALSRELLSRKKAASASDKKLESNYRKLLLARAILGKPLPSRRLAPTVMRNLSRSGAPPKSEFFAGRKQLSKTWPVSDTTLKLTYLFSDRTMEELMEEKAPTYLLGNLVAVHCLIQETSYKDRGQDLPGSGLFRQSAFAASRNPAGYLRRWEEKAAKAYWRHLNSYHRWAAEKLLGSLLSSLTSFPEVNTDDEIAQFMTGFRVQLADGLYFAKPEEQEAALPPVVEVRAGLPGF